jgi:cysteine-rich repeat protein
MTQVRRAFLLASMTHSVRLTALVLLLVACSGQRYSLGYPDDSTAQGGTANGGTDGNALGGVSGGPLGASGGDSASGTANTGGNGATGNSANGGNSASGGNSGSSANAGSSAAGSVGASCTTDLDCAEDAVCVFKIADGCAAHATCEARPASPACKTIAAYCGCSGSTVSVACDEPPGFAAAAVKSAGACANSKVPVCGNGIVEPGEQCDDGALAAGDGCSATCQSEALVVPASDFVCAMSTKGAVKCWGRNDQGQLGQGDTTTRGGKPGEMGLSLKPIDLGTGRRAASVVTGDSFACALLDNHSVKCWGKNNYGQLGQGDTQNRGDQANEMGDALPAIDLGTGRSALSIGAESVDVCAVLDDHTVKCWGWDGGGELCVGEENPFQDAQCRGDQPGEMGDNLQRALIGTTKSAVMVSAGSFHACVLFSDGTVKCWGTNQTLGQLGLGDQEERGNYVPNLGDNLPTISVGTGRTVKSITAGVYHTCVILDDDSLKCWGANVNGELGLGDTAPRGGNPGEMGDALGTVNLGTGRHATRVALGNSYSCAVLDDASLKCWGANALGELGLGDTTDRGGKPSDMGDNLPVVNLGSGRTVLAVASSKSGYVSSAELDTRAWKCWGDNEYAQLGLGVIDLGRGSLATDMGDNLPFLDLGF